ncbi:hypothetical protein KI387_024774, partial [Taxus chinensis]
KSHLAQMSAQSMRIAHHPPHSAPPNSDSDSGFKILKEELCYSRYLNVYNRIVEYPPTEEVATESSDCKGKIVQYDIVGSKTVSFHFCAVFPFDTLMRSVTLIKEYAQGGNCYMYGVPCGGLSEKHLSLEDCARKELSEEAQLQGGNLVKLIPDDHPGLLEVKWCRNRFTPFVLLDPEKDVMPRPMDPEEVIEVLTVDIPTLKEIMYGGSMMLPSVVTFHEGVSQNLPNNQEVDIEFVSPQIEVVDRILEGSHNVGNNENIDSSSKILYAEILNDTPSWVDSETGTLEESTLESDMALARDSIDIVLKRLEKYKSQNSQLKAEKHQLVEYVQHLINPISSTFPVPDAVAAPYEETLNLSKEINTLGHVTKTWLSEILVLGQGMIKTVVKLHEDIIAYLDRILSFKETFVSAISNLDEILPSLQEMTSMESLVLAIEGILKFEHQGTCFLWCLHLKSRKTLLEDSMIHYDSMCNEAFTSLSLIQEFMAEIPCNIVNEHNQRCSSE